MGDNVVLCPTCGRPLDLNTYSSLMVPSEDHGLFTMKCNFCNEEFSSVERIPLSLREQVESVAHSVNAGMGKN